MLAIIFLLLHFFDFLCLFWRIQIIFCFIAGKKKIFNGAHWMWNVSFNWVVMLQKSTYGSLHIFYVYHNIPKCIRKQWVMEVLAHIWLFFSTLPCLVSMDKIAFLSGTMYHIIKMLCKRYLSRWCMRKMWNSFFHMKQRVKRNNENICRQFT